MKTSVGPFGILYRHITVQLPGFHPYEYKVAVSCQSPVSLTGIGLEVWTLFRQQITTADEKRTKTRPIWPSNPGIRHQPLQHMYSLSPPWRIPGGFCFFTFI